MLFKYVQEHNLNEGNFKLPYNSYEYGLRMQNVVKFVDSLTSNQLKKLYKSEISDNFFLQGATGAEDIFQHMHDIKMRKTFQRIKDLATVNEYNFKALMNTNDEELLLEKEILMNYEYYVSLEKQRLLEERRRQRIDNLIQQIDPDFFAGMNQDEVLQEIYKQFSQDEIDEGLLEADNVEFPEIEKIKLYQEYIKHYDSQYI